MIIGFKLSENGSVLSVKSGQTRNKSSEQKKLRNQTEDLSCLSDVFTDITASVTQRFTLMQWPNVLERGKAIRT